MYIDPIIIFTVVSDFYSKFLFLMHLFLFSPFSSFYLSCYNFSTFFCDYRIHVYISTLSIKTLLDIYISVTGYCFICIFNNVLFNLLSLPVFLLSL